MTDRQVELLYNALLETWPNLPSWEHEPRRFQYYVNMFRHCHREKWDEILTDK